MFVDFLQILCVEGVEFEPFPTGLSLPPKAGPHTVILLGIPHSVGQLRITGQYYMQFLDSDGVLTFEFMKSVMFGKVRVTFNNSGRFSGKAWCVRCRSETV